MFSLDLGLRVIAICSCSVSRRDFRIRRSEKGFVGVDMVVIVTASDCKIGCGRVAGNLFATALEECVTVISSGTRRPTEMFYAAWRQDN